MCKETNNTEFRTYIRPVCAAHILRVCTGCLWQYVKKARIPSKGLKQDKINCIAYLTSWQQEVLSMRMHGREDTASSGPLIGIPLFLPYLCFLWAEKGQQQKRHVNENLIQLAMDVHCIGTKKERRGEVRVNVQAPVRAKTSRNSWKKLMHALNNKFHYFYFNVVLIITLTCTRQVSALCAWSFFLVSVTGTLGLRTWTLSTNETSFALHVWAFLDCKGHRL